MSETTVKPTTRLDRLKYIVELSKMSRAQFSKRIGMDPSNFSKYIGGRLPVNDALINKVALDFGVSRQWLRDGSGTPYEKNIHAESLLPSDTRISKIEEREGIPVYDIDVMAGSTPLSRMFTNDRIIGRVSLPQMNPESLIVRVTGDSMEPTIKDGAYINIRPVNDSKIIFWGQVYVVILEEYRMVKFVRKNPDTSKVTLHSANPDYDDIEIDRDDIKGLYLVESVINFDVRC